MRAWKRQGTEFSILMAVILLRATAASGEAVRGTPYTNDANTILLDHLDGAALMPISAYTNNGQACGSPLPSAAPNFSYENGPRGLVQALALRPPLSAPASSGTYLRHPTVDLLCTANGTLEFWCKPSAWNYGLASQGPYFGSCAGWTFGVSIDSSGHLTATDWAYSGGFIITGTNVITTNTWTHVAVSWGSAGARLYQNGVLVAASPNTTSPAPLFGGYLLVNTGAGECSLDEIRFSNIQRTTFNVVSGDTLDINLKDKLVELTLNGNAGFRYRIEHIAFLSSANWTPLATLTLTSNSCLVLDTNSLSISQRFYRAVLLPSPPFILSQPQGQSADAGADIAFSVVVAGSAPLNYQWNFNGASINSATNSTLVMTNVQAGNQGAYSASIANSQGATSTVATVLTVLPARPRIIQQPAAVARFYGENATVTVAARGSEPITCQWQREGTNIPGATGFSLTLTNLQMTDAGSYRAVLSNVVGTTNSAEASLIVQDRRPSITLQPTNQSLYPMASVTLRGAATGYGTLNYQWRFNGTNIPGATSSTLNLTAMGANNVGAYVLFVTNAYGPAKSSNAVLSLKTVAAWGAGTTAGTSPHFGQAMAPADLTNAAALAGGQYHSLALLSNGSVRAWGAGTNYTSSSPHYGQSVVPAGLQDVVSVATGYFHSLALKRDGTVIAWGAGTNRTSYFSPHYRQSVVPSNLVNVVAIAAGAYHSLALKGDGTVVAWGWGQGGQTNVPEGLSNVIAVAAGNSHSLALKSDGSVVAWGSNTYGETNLPPELTNVMAIAAGDYHDVALRTDGTITNWGKSVGNPASYTGFIAIAASGDHSIGIKTNGGVYTWGNSSYGLSSPPTGVYAAAVSAGFYHDLALLDNGAFRFIRQPASCSAFIGGPARLWVLASCLYPMKYQWQFNGTNIAGATTSTLVVTNAQFTNAGYYRVLIATNSSNPPIYQFTSAPALLSVSTYPAVGLGAALNATNLPWTTTGSAQWYGQTNVSHDGASAAQSGAISDSQNSTLQAVVVGPGTLSFWWKVSSEDWFDGLDFYLNTTQVIGISGSTEWREEHLAIPSGVNTLTWSYSKDASVSSGQDAGWLDQITFTPTP